MTQATTQISSRPTFIDFNPRNLRVGAQPISVWFLGFTFWFATSIALPFIGADNFLDTLFSTSGFLAYFTIQFSIIRLTMLMIAGKPRYMAINFWVFVYIFFGIASFLQLDSGNFLRHQLYRGGDYATSVLTLAQFIVVVGCVSYELGAYFLRHRPPRRMLTAPPSATVSLSDLNAVTLIAVIAGVIYIGRAGASIVGTRDSINSFEANSVNNLIRMVLFGAAFLILATFHRARIHDWRALSGISQALFIVCVAECLIVNNPSTTQRATVGAVIGGLAAAYVSSDSKRFIRLMIIALIAGTVIVYPALNTFRRADPTNEISVTPTGFLGDLKLADENFNMFAQVGDGIEYVDEFGHDYGKFFLASSLVFVPRSIWTSKALDAGDTTHDALGYPSRYNYSSPLWMESYVEGGFPVLIAVFLALGAISFLLDLHFVQVGFGRLALMAPAIAFYLPYVLRGSTLAASAPLYALLGTLLLVLRSTRSHTSHSRALAIEHR